MVDWDPLQQHLAACARFGEAVAAAQGKWCRDSPCTDWHAKDVLEHVIGFHDVLLLGPLGFKPDRPANDPQQRWEVTISSLREALSEREVLTRTVAVPGLGQHAPAHVQLHHLLPALSQDVFVHAWDLAKAVGANDRLDLAACELYLSQLPTDAAALSASGMFAQPLFVHADSDVQSRLLGRLGRDPSWQPQE